MLLCVLVKAYMRRHVAQMRPAQDPVQSLIEACGCITAEMNRWLSPGSLMLVMFDKYCICFSCL
jgi:hypothetical protein